MEQFTIFYESLRGLWWILSTNTLQCFLVIYTHFWTYNLKKNAVLNRKCSFIKFYLSLKWVFLFIKFGYLFSFSCLCFHSFFFNRWIKIQSLTNFTKVENNQDNKLDKTMDNTMDNTMFYVVLILLVVSAISNIFVVLFCCIYKSGQCNCKAKKRELIIYFTNQLW